jgi:Fe-S cluster assembly ATPase SufC
VLKGKGEEFTKARRKEVDENIAKMSKEERKAKFNDIVLAYQEPLENEEVKAEFLEGQTYRDVNNESRFGGNGDQGKEIFKRIKERQELRKKEEAQLQELRELEAMEGVESSQNNPQQVQQPPQGRGRWENIPGYGLVWVPFLFLPFLL